MAEDNLEALQDGIGVVAELMFLFWKAVRQAGADEETAINLTSIYLNAIMYYEN